MIEIRIKSINNNRQIALMQNGIIEEYYEEDQNQKRNEGNIYIGIVKDIVKGMQSAFVDIGTDKNSFIHLKDILPKIDETKETLKNDLEISKVIKPNQKLLVQVKKDSTEKKGARISTHINLPSKYIVFMPNTNIITVSQKIEDEQERKRLMSIVKENLSQGNGAIIRTSAIGKSNEIISDIKYIENKWKHIIQTNVNPENIKPYLLYKSEDIVEKMLIDLSENTIEKIIVDNKEEAEKIEQIKCQNSNYEKIEIEIVKTEDIFSVYDIENQIEKIKNRKVWLKCGGFITIDKTEALTAIDVNTGKYTGKSDLEETVYKVNEEATIEIAKQLKLRDIGGIIIIDYIDMINIDNKRKIENLVKEELKKDRSKTQVEGFTKLDLMEITRKHICSHKE